MHLKYKIAKVGPSGLVDVYSQGEVALFSKFAFGNSSTSK